MKKEQKIKNFLIEKSTSEFSFDSTESQICKMNFYQKANDYYKEIEKKTSELFGKIFAVEYSLIDYIRLFPLKNCVFSD